MKRMRVTAEKSAPAQKKKAPSMLTRRRTYATMEHVPQPEEVVRRRVMSVSGASARGSHQLSDALTCEQKWTYRYGLGIRPRYSKDFQVIGTLVHTRLAYYLASLLSVQPEWAKRPIEDQLAEDGQGWPLLIAQSADVAQFVIRSLEMRQYPIVPAAVEHEWRATLGDIAETYGLDPDPVTRDEVVTSRSDVTIWEPDGSLSILDHKCVGAGNRSTGRLGVWHPEQYQAGLQPFLNVMLARTQMRKTQGPVVRHFKIHRIKRTAPYDRDINFVALPDQAFVRAFRMCEQAVQREQEMQKRIADGAVARVNLSACNGRYGLCDYYGACMAGSPDIRESVLSEGFIHIGPTTMPPPSALPVIQSVSSTYDPDEADAADKIFSKL